MTMFGRLCSIGCVRRGYHSSDAHFCVKKYEGESSFSLHRDAKDIRTLSRLKNTIYLLIHHRELRQTGDIMRRVLTKLSGFKFSHFT